MTKKNLFDQFINAAVRQVGRDGGKVISNIVYGDKHSIPLRNASKGNDSNIVLPEPQRRNFSSSFIKPKVGVLSRIVWLVPLVGFLTYILEYYSISLTKGNYLIDWEEENYIPDKRCVDGYRLNGWIRSQTVVENELEYSDLVVAKGVKRKVLIWILISLFWNIILAFYFGVIT